MTDPIRDALAELVATTSNYVKPRRAVESRQLLLEALDAARAVLSAQPTELAAEMAACAQARLKHKEQIVNVTDEMVSRFLTWKLPQDFYPDSGVSFTKLNHPNAWPVGTNLLTAIQARQMLEHVLAASLPAPDAADAKRYRWLRGGPDVPQHSHRWSRWEVRYWDGRFWQTMFATGVDEGVDAGIKNDAALSKGATHG